MVSADRLAVEDVPVDIVVSRLAASSRIRIATMIPGTVGVVYALATGQIVRPVVLVGIVVVISVLGVVGALRLYPGDPATDPRARRFEERWQALSVGVGCGLTVPFFRAVELDVEVMAGIFGIVWVIGAFVFHTRYRPWMMIWIGVTWLLVLLTNGVTDPAVLAVHALGAVSLLLVVSMHSRRLMDSLFDATRARREAQQRANLLASLLRTNTLDPDEVLSESVRGLIDVGFDFATIRMLDHGEQVARLVQSATRREVDLPEQLGFDEGEFGLVAASGRPRMIRAAVRDPSRTGYQPIWDVYVLPLRDGTEVEATISVATSDRTIDPSLQEAADLLAEQASEAFARARAYRADARIVAELRRIELRTREYVVSISHELRTPLTVLHGLGRTLRARWDDLEQVERRDLIARMSRSATRLTAAVDSLSESTVLQAESLAVEVSAVPLQPFVEQRLAAMGAEERGLKMEINVDRGTVVHVDEVLFGYLVDEALRHVFADARGDPAREVSGEIVARVLGGRASITIALGNTRSDAGTRLGELGLARRGWLGVGLSMAEEIVQAHDGRLIVAEDSVSFDVAAVPTA